MRAALLAFYVITAARGAEPVFESQDAPPAAYSPLVWRNNGIDVHGIWVTDEAIQRLQVRLAYLENKAAADCINTTDADTKAVVGSKSSLWIVGATALVVGIVGGVVATKHFGR